MPMVLEQVIEVAPRFHQLIPYAHFVVTDLNGYIFSIPGRDFFIPAFDAGQSFRDGSIGREVTTKGVVVTRVGNPEVSGGIPYQGTGVPLFEDDKVVGSMCMFASTRDRDILHSTSVSLSAMVQQLSATMDQLREKATALSTISKELSEESHAIEGSSKLIGDMANVIADVSARTRIIGLNASIEAARAGEAGQSFRVIAAEVRKLSEQTGTSSKTVLDATNKVVQALREIDMKIQSLFEDALVQQRGTDSLADTIDEIVRVSTELTDLAARVRS